MNLTPQEFVAKWRSSALNERSATQQHFIDLCNLLGHPSPADIDPAGTFFTFEAGASKVEGGQGFADVWYKGHFAWEYKGKHANLDKAYGQLLQYREALENPPLLVVSDIDSIIIHTNFTNTVKRKYTITLADLLQPDPLAILRRAFYDPEALKVPETPAQVTEKAAAQFARIADALRQQARDPEQTAHFLIRLLFCLFAEDAGLLPPKLFTRLLEKGRSKPAAFNAQLRQLFGAMATGGFFGPEEIPHFDGRLFDDDLAIELDRDSLEILFGAGNLDWAAIEPSIFGSLFERGLDPGKRAQLGAHYTSKEDILLIVEPVLMAPLRREWDEVRDRARDLARRRDAAKGTQRTKLIEQLSRLLMDFAEKLSQVQVLDPACGSGNFLYIALRQLLDLEKEVRRLVGELGLTPFFPRVHPGQLHGIEINEYAHQLAQATIQIGYIQWLRENGFGAPPEPILKPLDNILKMDAILAYDEQGQPVEPAWPEADVIIGNPPFLGGNKIRQELGDSYVNSLFFLYENRVPGFADLVCYWFEKARALIMIAKSKRAGLLATQNIRIGANRKVLDRIKGSGDIFYAMSDRPWILEGAAVRVSMVGFDNGEESHRILDNKPVSRINSDLRSTVDITKAFELRENDGIAFIGDTKKGAFDITEEMAKEFIKATGNPNGRPNTEVIKPWVNAYDVVQYSRKMWIIDFGTDMTEIEASRYEKPFEFVRIHVKPARDKVRNKQERMYWWLHARPAPQLRQALKKINRCIITPEVSRHRIFTWINTEVIIDHKLYVFVRDDDYFFGVLHSKAHEIWSLQKSGRQGVGNDPAYNSRRCFGTFPFPWPPGREPQGDPRVVAIAQAAGELVRLRDAWLNPPGLDAAGLKPRTLTNLYNQRPAWLDLAHRKLDAAVLAAYGWPADLPGDEILERLLRLNLERYASGGEGER